MNPKEANEGERKRTGNRPLRRSLTGVQITVEDLAIASKPEVKRWPLKTNKRVCVRD